MYREHSPALIESIHLFGCINTVSLRHLTTPGSTICTLTCKAQTIQGGDVCWRFGDWKSGNFTGQRAFQSRRCGSSMGEVLGSIHSTRNGRKKKKNKQEKEESKDSQYATPSPNIWADRSHSQGLFLGSSLPPWSHKPLISLCPESWHAIFSELL